MNQNESNVPKWIIKMNENGSKSPKIVTQMKQIESKSTKKVSTSKTKSLWHSLIARVSLIEKCACRAISSDFNTAHKKICVSSDIKMRFFWNWMSLPWPMSIERRRRGVLSPPWSCLIKLGVMSTVRIILFALVQSFYKKPFWKLFNQYSITWLFDLFGRCILPNQRYTISPIKNTTIVNHLLTLK